MAQKNSEAAVAANLLSLRRAAASARLSRLFTTVKCCVDAEGCWEGRGKASLRDGRAWGRPEGGFKSRRAGV